MTLSRAIEIIANALGVSPRISYEASRRGDQRHTAADVAEARLTFGYQPTVLPEEGLSHQVAWHREALA